MAKTSASTRPRGPSGKELRAQLKAPPKVGASAPDPLAPDMLKNMLSRVGLIALGIWILAGLVYAVWPSGGYIPLFVAGGLTLVGLGLVIWTLRRASSAREVAALLAGVQTAEDRRAAIEKLESQGKKNDPASVFARAQLEAQEDPRKALSTLESLELGKLLGPVADEARGQRAMLHLGLGEVSLARQLIDNIDLKRAGDPRSRAMLGAICAEAWARSGEPKRALDTLDVFDQKDEALAQLLPQLLRAYAFAYAVTTKTKDLKRVLRRMIAIEPRLLGGFLGGKTHPLLAKEAKRALEQSGAVPRRMQIQRMR